MDSWLPPAHRRTLLAFLLVMAVTWVRPAFPVEQALHHSLTAVGVAALLAAQRRRPLPYSSFLLIVVFLTVHTIAARWIYSFVPYDDWTGAAFGVRLSDVFGWQRNHFDRLVHLTYGLVFGVVLLRALRDWRGWRTGPAALAAIEVVLSTSALYELFEWAIAVTLGAGAAEAYNGQQGDMWDAHKDMALAMLGAILTTAAAAALRRGPGPGPDPVSRRGAVGPGGAAGRRGGSLSAPGPEVTAAAHPARRRSAPS